MPRRWLFRILCPTSKPSQSFPQNELSQQLVSQKIAVIMRVACCSEFLPMDCAQESKGTKEPFGSAHLLLKDTISPSCSKIPWEGQMFPVPSDGLTNW